MSGAPGLEDALRALVALAERERELVRERELDPLPALHTERDRLMAALPPQVPPEAHPLVAHALRVQGETTALLGAACAEAARELARLDHGRRSVVGYRPAVDPGYQAAG